jgi:hypothetical protein
MSWHGKRRELRDTSQCRDMGGSQVPASGSAFVIWDLRFEDLTVLRVWSCGL